MSIYLDKLAHIQVVINYQFFVAKVCSHDVMLTHNLGSLFIDDIMSYNSLKT